MTEQQNQQVSDCDIFKNATGEILLVINAYSGGPENPRLVYDGGSKAILYRSKESSIVLKDISVDARAPIKAVAELLIVEVEGNDVLREYTVPLRVIKSIDALAKSIKVSI
ncbi:MAG: hypothetical protein R3Y43_08025 [Alphaproteobacteria bacterium]